MEHGKSGREEARGFQRAGRPGIVGGDEQHEGVSALGGLRRDIGVIAFGRAADGDAARG